MGRRLLRLAIHPDAAFLLILLLKVGDKDSKHLFAALLKQRLPRLVEVLCDLVACGLLPVT